jgi:hypothetical protein
MTGGAGSKKTTEKNVGLFQFILSATANLRGRQTLKLKERTKKIVSS